MNHRLISVAALMAVAAMACAGAKTYSAVSDIHCGLAPCANG